MEVLERIRAGTTCIQLYGLCKTANGSVSSTWGGDNVFWTERKLEGKNKTEELDAYELMKKVLAPGYKKTRTAAENRQKWRERVNISEIADDS